VWLKKGRNSPKKPSSKLSVTLNLFEGDGPGGWVTYLGPTKRKFLGRKARQKETGQKGKKNPGQRPTPGWGGGGEGGGGPTMKWEGDLDYSKVQKAPN